MSFSICFTVNFDIAWGVAAFLKRRSEAAYVVASCVRADSRVAMVTWNGSSSRDCEIFSTAGSSRPVIATASRRITASTGAGQGWALALRDWRDRRLAFEDIDDVPRDEIVHRGARFGSGARHVRHEHNVIERQQSGVDSGLIFVDIETRAFDDAFS